MGARDRHDRVELDGQYRALREEAGYLRRRARDAPVRGPDAAEYLQGQLTNDVEALAAGRGLLRGPARPQGAPRVGHARPPPPRSRLLWIDLEPGPAARRAQAPADLQHRPRGRDRGRRRAVGALLGDRPARCGAHRLRGTRAPEHAQRVREWDGVETAGGRDRPRPRPDRPRRPGRGPGAPARRAGAARVSEQAAEILRIESGRPRFGLDMGPESMPAEAGIVERAVDFEKGCYIGQEPVARLHYRGKPNRTLRGLRLSAPAAPGEPLRAGREGGRQRRQQLPLPRLRADRARDRPPGGRRRRAARGRATVASPPSWSSSPSSPDGRPTRGITRFG